MLSSHEESRFVFVKEFITLLHTVDKEVYAHIEGRIEETRIRQNEDQLGGSSLHLEVCSFIQPSF